MEIERLKRYTDKFKLIEKRMGEFEEWKDDFLDDEKSRLACYMAFEQIIEFSMDLTAMICKDTSSLPKDNFSNIECILEKKIISDTISKSLKVASGLRNRIVQNYEGLDSELAYESMVELLPDLEDFLEMVDQWLKIQPQDSKN
ncbi:MAG: DUF86 domain-containing protein [Candidatus Micrarchaeota archaeon]